MTEFAGAIAVVVTLAFLAVQVRQTKAALLENARMTGITVLDQHTQAQSRWRGRLADNEELARIWITAREGVETLSSVDVVRFTQFSIDYFNTWRASFAGAQAVGHHGQMDHIVAGCVRSLSEHKGLRELWTTSARSYSALVVPDFVEAIDERV